MAFLPWGAVFTLATQVNSKIIELIIALKGL